MSVKLCVSVVAVGAAASLAASAALGSITIPTVPIGNAGNAADPTTGLGSVAHTYNIGSTEVTNAQYAAFLNAKAASDPNALYNPFMATGVGGITRSGTDGSYTYSTITGRESNPVNYVSFWDAARFANWLHNGQGAGDTETGAYTLTPAGISANAVARNAYWQWAIAGEDEWYKAAYHQPANQGGDAGGYWRYPNSSNAMTTADANFGNLFGNTTPVGSYAPNFYGTFDMGGNVWEWTEATIFSNARIVRGGSFDDGFGNAPWTLEATYRAWNGAWGEHSNIGFRVVAVPGPSAVALLAVGGLVTLRRRRA